MRRFARPYRGALVMAIVMTMAETVVALAQPWPMKFVVDNALGGRPLPDFLQPLSTLSVNALAGVAAGVLVVLIAAGALLGYLSTYLSGAASERIGADLRGAVHERLLLLPVRFHDEHRSGELVSRLVSDVDRVQDALVVSLVTTLPGVLTFIGVIALMFTIDPVLSVAALVILPILGAVVVARRNAIRRAQRRAREEEGRLAALATDVVRNVRAVQAFNHEPVAQARFEHQNLAAARASIFALDLEARFSPLADIVLAIGSAAVLWFGVTRVTSGRITLGVLLVFLAYLASLYAPIRSFARLARTMAKASASRERIVHVLSDSELAAEDPDPVTAGPPTTGLCLRDVSFSYCSESPVLRNVSLEIPAGDSVCLVGPSGVGKSTLLALLLRFYDPGSGAIELDGVDFRRFSLTSLRRQFALVPQDAWIVDGTIAENIAFGRTDATMADVQRAGAIALVDEFVHRLPKSYDTIVGESGSLLSGGQRRRIALARAVVRDAPVLLLDEPTSGLDPTSEDAVIEAIRNAAQGKTLLVASHRLSVAAITDRVVVFEDGHVIEDGTPSALLDRNGEFARLWSLQHRDHLRDDAAHVSLSSTPTRR
jgi:ABC-type multidrug transport system fused ATPase/permease subunit